MIPGIVSSTQIGEAPTPPVPVPESVLPHISAAFFGVTYVYAVAPIPAIASELYELDYS